MVSGTSSAEQRVWDADKPDPGDRAAAAFAYPISLLPEMSLPHLSLCTVSQGHGERGCHPVLPASGSFEIWELKSGLFSSLV